MSNRNALCFYAGGFSLWMKVYIIIIMVLHIDTTKKGFIEILVTDKKKTVAGKRISASMKEAEKLLPMVENLLAKAKVGLKKIKKIQVANQGGTFTSLRIGVITANALGYALGAPVKGVKSKKLKVKSKKFGFDIIEPIYDREPSITTKKAF